MKQTDLEKALKDMREEEEFRRTGLPRNYRQIHRQALKRAPW
jgi:hypothetical protein